jgi:hypothetical protein
MAPEQILNQPVDARTDLYAFGILLYQMCTGKLPFDVTAGGGGEFEIMEKQVREDPVAPHELVPSLPLALSDLILRLLAKNPADRPVDCKEVRDDLHTLLRQESKDSRAGAIRMPTRQASEDSNAEIARGLLKALFQKLFGVLRPAKSSVKSDVSGIQGGAEKHPVSIPLSKRWQAPLTFGVLALSIIGIGWVLVNVIDLAERPPSAGLKPEAEISPVVSQDKSTADKAVTNVMEPKPVTKDRPVAEAKSSPKKVVASKKTATKTAAPRPKKKSIKRASRSITYSVKHRVIRNDNSRVDPNKPHEFRGGKRVWFTSLKDYRWKDRFRSFKKGEIKLYLDKPTRLSKIVIHKASVGRLDFKGGEVRLSVQDSKGRWKELFVRKDDDVDIKVTITRPSKYLKDVKGVILRFKTPEPITIGPIDLIR